MFVHLGKNTVITEAEILGIFDMDKLTVTKLARDYLAAAEKSGTVINVSPYDLPKSFIVTKNGKVYISPLTAETITKRIGEGYSYA